MFSTETPFVLLDDARTTGASPARLYCNPVSQLTARHVADIPEMLDALRCANGDGYHVAGFLQYEAGHALAGTPMLAKPGEAAPLGVPLGWFGIFESFQEIAPDAVASRLPSPAGAYLSCIKPDITPDQYGAAFEKVQEYIRAGDIYQANLTFQASANYAGDPLALYAAVRPNAAAGYGGVVWTGSDWILSFSPELFFALSDRRITTRPMKGTARRMADPVEDAKAADALRTDPKQRAENLMIVDLLRNDISRVCVPGSVQVPELFRIETYPTVHQMTSAVTGELQAGQNAVDVIAALFPCGSITGAPKIRAMEIVAEVEHGPRGMYCGSIGRIDANGDAAFNVAIRSFHLNTDQKQVSLGLGSGIVADSVLASEWTECLTKGEFAAMGGSGAGHKGGYGFDLIETMRFEPAVGILRLELHLERMKESARVLDFEFDRHAARNGLHAVTFHLEVPQKIRMMLSRRGSIAIEVGELPPANALPWPVRITPLPVDSGDFRLRHKTSDRAFYDDARKAHADCTEVLFTDAEGFLTEGSFTSVFVMRGDVMVTPPLARGLLPCVLRRELIEHGKAIEADLRIEDLTGAFFVGNSLRGLHAARLIT
jgi:para-aminobenzoate synthetase / 4-amino-4-deoxychorismate lyase